MANENTKDVCVFQKDERRKGTRRRVRGYGASGFTLIEVAISILIVMTLVTGVMGYQYRSSYDVRFSEVQATAARLSMLLLEGWKGEKGDAGFDPVSAFGSDITIHNSAFGPDIPDDKSGTAMNLLGHYAITMEGVCYYVTLSWSDASSVEPKVLTSVIGWRRDYRQDVLQGDEAYTTYSTFYVDY